MNTTRQRNQTYEECVKENFGRTTVDCNDCYSLPEFPQWNNYTHVCITGIIIIVSLVGNILFFVLMLKSQKLRTRANMIGLSVILANTGLVLSFHIQVMISTACIGWEFGFLGCQIFGFLSTQFIFTRWLTMGVLALDRFCAVRYPFSYPRHCKVMSVILVSSSWAVPILLSVVTVQGYASVAFRHNIPSCLYYAPTNAKGKLYFSIVFTSCFILGGALPLALYSWLFYKGLKFQRSLNQVHSTIAENCRQSVAMQQDMQGRANREHKAIFTFALIFAAFCLTGTPIYVFQLLRWINMDMWCEIPYYVQFKVIELFLLATAIDPFLVMRDRDIRKRLKHLLCCHNNCGKYYSNRSDVCPELPQERNFDAIRTVASHAATLVALKGCVDNHSSPLNTRKPLHQGTSASGPALNQTS